MLFFTRNKMLCSDSDFLIGSGPRNVPPSSNWTKSLQHLPPRSVRGPSSPVAVQRLWVKSMVVNNQVSGLCPQFQLDPTYFWQLSGIVWSFVNSPWLLKSSLLPLPPSSLCKCLQALAERSHKRRSGLKRSLCSGSIGLGLGVLNILLQWGGKNTKTLHKSVSCKPVCPKTQYARNQQVI